MRRASILKFNAENVRDSRTKQIPNSNVPNELAIFQTKHSHEATGAMRTATRCDNLLPETVAGHGHKQRRKCADGALNTHGVLKSLSHLPRGAMKTTGKDNFSTLAFFALSHGVR